MIFVAHPMEELIRDCVINYYKFIAHRSAMRLQNDACVNDIVEFNFFSGPKVNSLWWTHWIFQVTPQTRRIKTSTINTYWKAHIKGFSKENYTSQSRTVSLSFAPQPALEQRRVVSFNPIVSISKSLTYLQGN